MSHCNSCGNAFPTGAKFCAGCGAQIPVLNAEPSTNPYQVSEAVIDAQPVSPPPEKEGESTGYNIRFGVSASISEMFSIWSASLGQLILISLIPMVPTFVIVLAAVIGFVVSMVSDFSSLLHNLETGNIGNLMNGFDDVWGWVAVVVVLFIVIVAFTIPSITGQFRLLDEKTRLGEHRTSVWQAYWGSFKYTLPLIGLGVLAYVALGVASIPGILLVNIPALSVVYFLALMVFASVVGIRLSLVLPIMVIEEMPLFAAMARSNEMCTGKTWTIMGIWGVMFLVMFGIVIVLMVLNFVPVIGQLVNMFSQLALTPLQISLFFTIYAGIKSPQRSL
ncbi:MAG: glycerophosphoryl diester phosphodiesterase membrane domain-containing protein [Deltaproteobacteria bacterium]|nr:glycerophosphoryl diester phosphodiesterase membrane domain-containing protein [Deltaproteobacteria bacterium]